MQKWEYAILVEHRQEGSHLNVPAGTSRPPFATGQSSDGTNYPLMYTNILEVLNWLGREGWEMIGTTSATTAGTSTADRTVFKRPKQ